jgi:hypothetical protein
MFAGVAKKSQHLGEADRGEYRQAAGAIAEAMTWLPPNTRWI